ncbi:hypothetical protein [Streptomyces liliifuscus]|uniref:Uncharacterized protein n=1 Tax=Streptomyces liliifuscus TaxID=2797636 RepID=A0A7T7RFV0_9ACTN|nr:hypothetical protein [Streptomyces liliifuscus]QQM45162.1 hypothetical protein JEQ17_41025 [Streptomyces liliifuscus]
MSASAQTVPSVTPWPEGVVARFVTVGGALVDVSHDMHLIVDTEPNLSIARCGGAGCDATHNEEWRDYSYRVDNGSSGADREASKWAQSHAEQCRALPLPTA